MKIFFASCVRQDNAGQTERVKLVERFLHDKDHSVYTYVYDQDRLDDKRDFGELAETILDSDLYIAEMSLPSQTLGFQIAFALNSTKPCLYLYYSGTHGKPDAPLSGHPSRLLKITEYTEETLEHKLDDFMQYGEKQLATRRTSFMSTREIDRFLDQESQRLGAHKAEIIRQILSEAVKNK